MKKLILLALQLLFIASYSYSQSGWFWQNPLPTGSNLQNVYFLDLNTGFAVGWNGVILKTTNSGYTWNKCQSNTNNKFYSINFINSNTGFAVSGDEDYSSDNAIYKTTNAGESWISFHSFPGVHLSKVLFINENTGFIIGYRYYTAGRVYKTIDGGLNWSEHILTGVNFINSIDFIGSQTGYIAGDYGSIYKTTNTGLNWNLLPINSTSNFKSISFCNEDTGFVSGFNGKIFKTQNGGANWIQSNLISAAAIWDIKCVSNDTILAAGNDPAPFNTGKIFKSINSGGSWDSITFSGSFKSIAYINNIIAVGAKGTIEVSSNFGSNWENKKSSFTNLNLNKVFFIDAVTGFCVGDSGKIFKTINAGINWYSQITTVDKNLTNCTFLNSQTGFAIGHTGTILKTTNAGINWLIINLNTPFNLGGISFPNLNTGFCTGRFAFGQFGQFTVGRVYKTTNQGNNWQIILDSNYHIQNCHFVNENTGYVCGGDILKGGTDRILKTTNGGNSWVSVPSGFNSIHYNIFFLNQNTGFVGGNPISSSLNGLFRTTNGGQNWINISFPVQADGGDIRSINFINQNTGIILKRRLNGLAGMDVFITNNNGLNWSLYSSSNYAILYNVNLTNLFPINDSLTYGVGEKGSVIIFNKKINIIGVNNISEEIPQNHTLSQNYPNPFNPTTKIKFDVPNTSFTKLVVYDLLGREVATLVSEELKPGTYQADWDATAFSSGVYFYKITAGEYTETKKMVLMK